MLWIIMVLRCLKQLLLNLILIQIVSSVVALLFFFSNRPETSIWIDCCQITYRHSQSFHGFHWKMLSEGMYYVTCDDLLFAHVIWYVHAWKTQHRIAVSDYSPSYFVRYLVTIIKKSLTKKNKSICSEALKAVLKLPWNRGCLKDRNYLKVGLQLNKTNKPLRMPSGYISSKFEFYECF